MKKAMTALTAFIAAACLLMTSCSDERLLRSVDDLICLLYTSPSPRD